MRRCINQIITTWIHSVVAGYNWNRALADNLLAAGGRAKHSRHTAAATGSNHMRIIKRKEAPRRGEKKIQVYPELFLCLGLKMQAHTQNEMMKNETYPTEYQWMT